MQLNRKNKVSTEFNMASMTDLVFLLLIFFMLTSNFVTPSGMPVNLPSTNKETPMQTVKTTVTITSDLRYFVNNKETSADAIEYDLKTLMKGDENVIVLHVDKTVPTEYFVKVASIANALGAKVSLATKPE
jgi:biopolymer transport protein ExbD